MNTIRIAGVEVPRIGLGTNRLTEEDADFIRAAVDAGLRHIDTAHLYTDGASERTIGMAIGARDDVLVATKGGYHDGSPEALKAEIEQSLASLRTDVIGLYYLHRPGPDLEGSLATIKEYVDRDTIRAVGISEVGVEEIERARAVVEIAAVQNLYNRAERDHDDVVDHCEQEGIAFVPYYPLHGDGTNAEKLQWLLDRSPVIAPIPGTRSIEHLRENLALL
jgi:aryl-alcohol dehydrogenase-like predicted oxidoreductase